MERLGEIVRLQVQKDRVKERGVGYRPEPILAVDEVRLSQAGVLGRVDAGWVVDVHHQAHPRRSNGTGRSFSVGFTSHYDLMRARFGGRVTDGIGGENVIVATNRRITEADLAAGVVLRTADDGDVTVLGFQVAAPCMEFTSYLLGRPDVAPQREVAADLRFLHQGVRGFVADFGEGRPDVTVRVGDEMWLAS